MTLLIIIFGILMLIAGALLLVNPEILFRYLRNNIDNVAIHVIAVLVRLIIGVLLIIQSNQSRFPQVIEILGWIFIVAGIFLAVLGRHRFTKLLSWVLTNLKHLGRIAGVAAVAFGGFLVYAFL
ncbi:MAG: hypothetical protein KTR35_17075 [Gammaproteobacteria bacterium]|nr:hypothetical protein [Gammaproteobacteria bacterium]